MVDQLGLDRHALADFLSSKSKTQSNSGFKRAMTHLVNKSQTFTHEEDAKNEIKEQKPLKENS
jgi:hypothetical protein